MKIGFVCFTIWCFLFSLISFTALIPLTQASPVMALIWFISLLAFSNNFDCAYFHYTWFLFLLSVCHVSQINHFFLRMFLCKDKMTLFINGIDRCFVYSSTFLLRSVMLPAMRKRCTIWVGIEQFDDTSFLFFSFWNSNVPSYLSTVVSEPDQSLTLGSIVQYLYIHHQSRNNGQ